MDFYDEIKKLAVRATEQIGKLQTEEATKTALVLPMLRSLGYDVFDPAEVIPEFTADIGIKKGEKVDYAIISNGKPSILFECKTIGSNLRRDQASQLYRYFTTTESRFGVLTDGVKYEFYSDLDEQNKMDAKAFFIFDLLNHTESDVRELRKFGKEKYDEGTILATANSLKYGRLIDAWLQNQLDQPCEEFVKLVGSQIYEGRMTAAVTVWMTALTKDALDRAIRSRVREKLQSALDRGKESTDVNSEDDPSALVPATEDGIVTTEQEMEGFRIVQAILSEVVSPERVIMRDAKSYCAILLDDNNRKPICRLRLDGKQWRIGTFKDKVETLNNITKLSEIFHLRGDLLSAANEYIASGTD